MPNALLAAINGIGATFVPTSIAGLQLWLKADVGVFSDAGVTPATNGQTVQQWNDQSGNGKNATQSAGGNRPTFQASGVSGLPALRFTNATPTWLTCGANSDFASQAFTVFVVYRLTNVTGAFMLCKGSGTEPGDATGVWNIQTFSGGFADTIFETFTGSTGSTKNDVLQCTTRLPDMLTLKRIDGNSKIMYRNGFQIAAGGDSGSSLNPGATPLGIGSDGAGTNASPWDGWIQEILYYNSALSDANRNAVESYLRFKWKISIASPETVSALGPYPNLSPKCQGWLSYSGGAVLQNPNNATNPLFAFPSNGGTGTSGDTQACSIIYYQGQYFVAFEINVTFDNGSLQDRFSISKATTFAGPWTHVADVIVIPSPVAASQVWQPVLFFDDQGAVHCIFGMANNQATFDTQMQLYIVDALNTSLTSWSSPTQVTGTGFAANMTDKGIISPGQSPNGKWNIFWKDESGTKQAGWSSSSSLKSGYTVTQTPASNWLGIGQAENYNMVKIGDIWRFFYSALPGPVDEDKFVDSFDNWATWSTVTSKTIFYPIADGGEIGCAGIVQVFPFQPIFGS